MSDELNITPGPWPLGMEDLRGGRYWVVSRPGRDESIDLHEDDNGEADARAIAALPDLIEAADVVVAKWLQTGDERVGDFDEVEFDELVQALRSALNKIKGGDNA